MTQRESHPGDDLTTSTGLCPGSSKLMGQLLWLTHAAADGIVPEDQADEAARIIVWEWRRDRKEGHAR